MKENRKAATVYELQKNERSDQTNVSKMVPPIREERSGSNGEILSFEDEVRVHHDKFTSILLGLLQEIQNLQADNFSGNINHVLYRLDFNGYYDQIKQDNDRMMESVGY